MFGIICNRLLFLLLRLLFRLRIRSGWCSGILAAIEYGEHDIFLEICLLFLLFLLLPLVGGDDVAHLVLIVESLLSL